MTNTLSTILLVDDDPSVLGSLVDLFKNKYTLITATSGAEAIARAQEYADIAVAVVDIRMEDTDGITAARKIRELRPYTSIIFHTGYPGDYEEREVDAREKPYDYIEKGRSADRLVRSVRNGVEAYLLKTHSRLRSSDTSHNFGLIGQSSEMQRVIHEISKVAQSDNKVMILGETGTGKELVARAIHNESTRRDGRWAVLHCNHKSPDLVESELFGHEKGAFTGADARRVGLFEYGDGGTIFLDEIGDLDITTQAKLLRVLESGEFTRIGDPVVRKTNVRILCATHKNLEEMVGLKSFREDLYYRLKGIRITLPPLRKRREDIPSLVEHFCERYSREQGQPRKVIDQSALDVLMRFDWPGNVRQLLDTVESVIVLSDSDLIMASDIEAYLKLADDARSNPNGDGLSARIEAYRRALVADAIRKTGGNIAAAAELLKTDKSNLRKYVNENRLTAE